MYTFSSKNTITIYKLVNANIKAGTTLASQTCNVTSPQVNGHVAQQQVAVAQQQVAAGWDYQNIFAGWDYQNIFSREYANLWFQTEVIDENLVTNGTLEHMLLTLKPS